MLKKENEDKKLLSKCVQELKMKRVEFDLLREVDILRRDKSLHVEKKAGGSGMRSDDCWASPPRYKA